jgi:hypothetical protein
MHRKAGSGDAVMKGMWQKRPLFEKSAHLLAGSSVKKAFMSAI